MAESMVNLEQRTGLGLLPRSRPLQTLCAHMLCYHTQRTHSVYCYPGRAPCKPCVSMCCDIYIYIYILQDRGDTHPANPAFRCVVTRDVRLSRRPNTIIRTMTINIAITSIQQLYIIQYIYLVVRHGVRLPGAPSGA